MSPEAALCVIDLETRKAVNQRNLDFLDEEGVAFNPVTNSLYARKPKNTILKFDAYGKMISSAEIEKGNIMQRMAPLGKEAIAVNPTTNRVYATNSGQSILYELDG